ncbi:hypothetical protein GCM10027036_30300 [Flavihumibacter cheonanensis]|uniref:gliding motility-associated C-terminal domain-containing protein n=1 Tax=Flavihumibacter cheonanensis TaxID=1442385 RepID=UPI001EF85957|nr:gliding motility-associated C-terminal domain-containing protein [Flavihumibacter cheonanensis]MCG7752946.1 gliding motility-associated C-terminal domain-containing protein [Flavihumibacter cheonanensis]
MKIWIFFLLLTLFYPILSRAQSTDCQVIADFEIQVDSITDYMGGVSVHRVVNTSKNFTSFKTSTSQYPEIFYDNFQPIGILKAGYHYFTLIATNGVCSDTVTKMIFKPGRIPVGKPNMGAWVGNNYGYHLPRSISNTEEKGYLLASRNKVVFEQSLLVNITKEGCVNWGYKTDHAFEINYVNSTGNGINMGAYTRVWGFGESGLFKLLDNGTKVWTKKISQNGQFLYPLKTTILPDNSFIHLSRNDVTKGTVITKFSTNGDVIWNKKLRFTELHNLTNTIIYEPAVVGNSIFIPILFGGSDFESPTSRSVSVLVRINISTGEIEWVKRFGNETDFLQVFSVAKMGDRLLMTGTYIKPPEPYYLTTIAYLDTDANIEKSVRLRDEYEKYFPSEFGIRVIDDNEFYVQLQSMNISFPNIDRTTSFVFKFDKDFKLLWDRTKYNIGITQGMGAVGTDGSLMIMGSSAGEGLDPFATNNKLTIQRFDPDFNQDTKICAYYAGRYEVVETAIPKATDFINYEYSNSSISVENSTLDLIEEYPQVKYFDKECRDYLDSCSFINIRGPETFCNLSGIYTYTADRNENCVQTVSWNLPDGAEEVSRTDNSISVRFTQLAEQKIFAFLKGTCVPIIDSFITRPIGELPPTLELGPDTSICEGTTLTLEVPGKYKSISWSTGEQSASVSIKSGGKYWVTGVDYCNNYQTDTIIVDIRSAIRIDFAKDTVVCVGTTLSFFAPDSLQQFQWLDINSNLVGNAANLSIKATEPAVYYFTGIAAGGCRYQDELSIAVHPQPALFIGEDTVLCEGEQAEFTADNSFDNYQWNTGSFEKNIIAKTAGTYILRAFDRNGCEVADTATILNVFARPRPILDKTSILCEGEERLLSPGAGFSRYTWQDNSSSTSLLVNNPGKYWVSVQDQNGCLGSDTTFITNIVSVPKGFLGEDSSICQYQELFLLPAGEYKSYSWNTGSNNNNITISKPGTYSLTVTDFNNCTGTDTISIVQKQCMFGLYVPNAFTPNRDGRNDRFRPLLYGEVTYYSLQIFNRFGQKVFSTNNPSVGWDGSINGVEQNSGNYLFNIQYQLNGQSLQQKKGSFLLIR